MPELSRHLGAGASVKGGWMSSLADALREDGHITLGIASAIAGQPCCQADIDGTTHFTIPMQHPNEFESLPTTASIERCKQIVQEFKPDIIHIHGTEKFYGLLTARGHISVPTVISIQGLIQVYERYYFGGMSFSELLRAHTLADIRYRSGLIHQKLKWGNRSLIEREIIEGNTAFIGRTLWDRAHLRDINPKARYFHCDELMRSPFYNAKWDRKYCRQFSIFSPTGEYPIKGIHWLLKAAAILKREFPALKVRIADGAFAKGMKGKNYWQRMKMSGYSKYLGNLVDDLDLHEVVQLTGQLTAEQMAEEIAKAHVFVMPSLVENSPNSLAEAMLVGTPCVVSLAGGMTSMVEDRRTAVCFPMGDEAMLAESVRMIYHDDELADSISREARKTAHKKHDKQTIVATMLEVYRSLCV
jgi:glycosyltransferase involved in cell wall biosynthesis